MPPSPDHSLTDAITQAARTGFQRLFANGEAFYYCALLTTGEGLTPCLSAWSWEALGRAIPRRRPQRNLIKWSMPDSPYYAFDHDLFAPVARLLDQRLQIDDATDDTWEVEWAARMTAMETALRQLDAEGLFGTGDARLGVFINAECLPPDEPNDVERAYRLNPPEVVDAWLREIAAE